MSMPNFEITNDDIKNIILNGNPELLVIKAREMGSKLGAKRDPQSRSNERFLTTSQIRAIFGTVRKIDMDWNEENPKPQIYRLTLLKPKMFYKASKEGAKGDGLKKLAEVFENAINFVIQEDDLTYIKNETERIKVANQNKMKRFKHFLDFFEAILAYHKVAGGN